MLKAEGQTINDADGVFYMEFADFYRKFKDVTITFDVTNWKMGSFLMIDDNGSRQVENRYSQTFFGNMFNSAVEDCSGCY